MFEQEMHTSVEQRIVIKFLAWEGVKFAEILRRLTAQFAEKTLSRTQVYDWQKKFYMTKSLCKIRLVYADREQEPVRRSMRWLNGKLLHTSEYRMEVPNQSFR